MDPCEEDSVVLQPSEEHQEDGSVPPTGSQDQVESTQGQEEDSGAEWDTDLETDSGTNQTQSLSDAELYLQACERVGTVPVSLILHHLGEANLNLNHYGLGPLGAKALAIVLQNNNHVTNLELEDNALQIEGIRYLMEMLQTNISIQSLNLSNNHLHLEGADIISKMLLDNYYIKSIKLSGNDFDDSAVKYFADALKGDYVVKELDLSHNKFCDAGGVHLGHMLASNVGIEVLNLSWNHLSRSGAVAVCAGLKVNSTLKQLQLSWNGFSHMESESLGQALRQNSTLVVLDLRSNRIDNQAVTLLCHGLATNDTLRVLKLANNPLTNIGALTLLKTVTHNTQSAVEEIDISTVFVCEAFMELLEEARQRRPALDVRYSVMSSVTRNLSAFHIFQALDKEGTLQVSTHDFRKAVKEAKIRLDQQQLEWLIGKFDKNCTATINYRTRAGRKRELASISKDGEERKNRARCRGSCFSTLVCFE
ncbi:leucine-rich repeat-containing protein 74A-like isoform X2 [Thunnus maccoyii]|uniref:leucine-rich repeat-containing protein 74A-like isoform X2 n=1 Tax=Thunnus maccoyii TaxID=8240 RepID=UPI001C4D6C7F|nr:leucine-rich repeat-containing protein 74A-like isoform X2 [Thunnus maccoyii]